jgi:hypothetical protein
MVEHDTIFTLVDSYHHIAYPMYVTILGLR